MSLALASLFTGCELFDEGFDQEVTVYSYPTGAEVTVNGENLGKTPAKVELGRSIAHQIELVYPGYKTYKETVTPVRNADGKALVRFGLMEDTGLYFDLDPSPVKAQMVTESLPRYVGPNAYEEMAALITEVDQRRESGQIGPVEHKYIVDQIVEFYTQ